MMLMLSLKYRFEARHLLTLFSALVLVACASVLGIEERKLDVAASYPAQGYEGCRPGTTCADCLDVHRPECEARASCADTSNLGECASCVCESCLEPVIDCRLDAACNAIWQCLQQSRCDLSEGTDGSCRTACADAIAANGGLSGRAFRDAAAIRTCAITESCLGCLPPERDLPPAGCSPENGCMGCADCFQQCLCSGDTFSVCQEACGEEAPPDACTAEDSCAGCTSCFQVCACQGGSFTHCTENCQLVTPTCSPENSCSDCVDCLDRCACEGGDSGQCQEACAGPSADDVCRQVSSGSGGSTCEGCTSCLASCTCNGTDLESCMNTCGMLACCEGGFCESGFYSECLCAEAQAGESCAEPYAGCAYAYGCDACTCDNCTDTYALCQETAGCPGVFECMRATRCQGSECLERCGSLPGQAGVDAAFPAAEALWACDQGARCSCEPQSAPPVQCGAETCSAFATDDVVFDACCPVDGGIVEGPPVQTAAAGTGSTESCGLFLGRSFPYATSCLPLNQPNEPPVLPGLLTGCPSGRIDDAPYHGALLQPCCRAKDNLCGYWDDITGLGCVDAAVFHGVSGPPCN